MKKIIKIIQCILNPQYFISYFNFVSPLFELLPLLKKLKKVNTLIDVGSNKGQFSILMNNYYPNIKIYSFEPQKKFLAIQKRILPFNNYFYNIALGSTTGYKKFYITKREDSSSILEPVNNESKYKIKKIKKIRIERLDNIINLKKLKKPVIIKLDIQGYELEALKGSKKILNKIDYLITEISFEKIYKKQVLEHNLINFLKKNNFLEVKRTNITKIGNKTFQADILFIKKR